MHWWWTVPVCYHISRPTQLQTKCIHILIQLVDLTKNIFNIPYFEPWADLHSANRKSQSVRSNSFARKNNECKNWCHCGNATILVQVQEARHHLNHRRGSVPATGQDRRQTISKRKAINLQSRKPCRRLDRNVFSESVADERKEQQRLNRHYRLTWP